MKERCMIQDDEKLVRRAQRGSKRAFGRIVGSYTARIFRFLFDMTGNYEDAQDLTQDVFLRVFLNIKKFRGDSKFSTWLYRIAYNIGIDFRRRKVRARHEDWDSHDYKISLERYNSIKEDGFSGVSDAIDNALGKLTPSQRSAVVLNYYHGFRMKEIGQILGCAEGTVRVHLFRAMKRLRKELKDFSPGE
jgi:RNA polymerase sigma-70 factor (ECF subfamily)